MSESVAASREEPARVEALFARLSRRVYNVACWHTRDAAAADDIVSVVFERVIRALPRYDQSRGCPDNWVFAIAMNAIHDYHRERRRHRTVSLADVEELAAAGRSPEDACARRDQLARLLDGVSRLRPREREVLTLRLAGGLSNDSIGTLYRLSRRHVAVIVHRAVRQLRILLRQEEEK